MAPTSAFIKQTELEDSASPRKPGLGQSLVIGSLKTAQDGSYQSLISELTASGSTVDKLLADRIIDQGKGNQAFLHSACSCLPHITVSCSVGRLKFDRYPYPSFGTRLSHINSSSRELFFDSSFISSPVRDAIYNKSCSRYGSDIVQSTYLLRLHCLFSVAFLTRR